VKRDLVLDWFHVIGSLDLWMWMHQD